MDKNKNDDPLEVALRSLRDRSGEIDLSRFEHSVWSEIAIRDERGFRGWFAWLENGRMRLSLPAVLGSAAVAVLVGTVAGFSQAASYEKSASLAMELRYVETIHPVMMSANHSGGSFAE